MYGCDWAGVWVMIIALRVNIVFVFFLNLLTDLFDHTVKTKTRGTSHSILQGCKVAGGAEVVRGCESCSKAKSVNR